jgi:hypothetical protein
MVDGRFQRAIKKEETFALPSGKRLEITAPGPYELSSEILVPEGSFISSDGAIIRYREEKNDRGTPTKPTGQKPQAA